MAWGFDWRALWLGAIALVALAVVPALVPDSGEPSPPPAATQKGSHGLAALVIAYGLFGFGYVITATFLVTIVRASVSLQPLEPIVWIVVGVTAVPSVALWTGAGRRFGDARAFAWACVLEALGVVASVLWIAPSGILVAASLLGGTFMGLTALGLIQGRRLGHGDPRRSFAIMTAAFGLGQIVGPAFAGVIYDLTGSLVAPSLAAGVALGAAALLPGAPATDADGYTLGLAFTRPSWLAPPAPGPDDSGLPPYPATEGSHHGPSQHLRARAVS